MNVKNLPSGRKYIGLQNGNKLESGILIQILSKLVQRWADEVILHL